MTDPPAEPAGREIEQSGPLDQQIDELTALMTVAPPDDRADLAGERGVLRLLRYEARLRPDELDAALADLTTATATRSGDHVDTHVDASLWSFARGLAHRYRAEHLASATELDRAIVYTRQAYLGPPHPEVDPQAVAMALAELHWNRYESRRDAQDGLCAADLDEAITIAEAAALRTAVDDDPRGATLWALVATARYERWQRAQDPHDLDKAVTSLQTAAEATEPDMARAAQLADLLLERGAARADAADLSAAIGWYERALDLAAPGQVGAVLRIQCAGAYLRRWEVTGDAADLTLPLELLDAALASEVADPDACLLAHQDRLGALTAVKPAALAAGTLTQAQAEARTRTMVAEAVAALDRCADADPSVRAVLAGQLAALRIWGTGEFPSIDIGATRRLLGIAETLPNPPADWAQMLATVAAALDTVDGYHHPGEATDYGAGPPGSALQLPGPGPS